MASAATAVNTPSNTELTDSFSAQLTARKATRAKRRARAQALPKRDRGGVDTYVDQIAKNGLLNRQQEIELAERYRATGDPAAFKALTEANLRFVVKVAHDYKGYKVPLNDLIQEGNLGLMMAVKKFDPARGYRLISYAVWWIRAYMQAYVMKSFSLVKIGTTVAQRKLFFKLRTTRREADEAAGDGERAEVGDIARTLGVRERDVAQMELRLAARDFSLDAKTDDAQSAAFIDLVPDETPDPEQIVSEAERRHKALATIEAMRGELDERESYIYETRMRSEQPRTLREVGGALDISRERVRQIQEGIVEKLRRAVMAEPAMALAA